ncbi:hypothetical protein N665_1114s0008 [Sinapis alba]|nr:hypothetical protein N665_1114s0008 [Sinapis alba]
MKTEKHRQSQLTPKPEVETRCSRGRDKPNLLLTSRRIILDLRGNRSKSKPKKPTEAPIFCLTFTPRSQRSIETVGDAILCSGAITGAKPKSKTSCISRGSKKDKAAENRERHRSEDIAFALACARTRHQTPEEKHLEKKRFLVPVYYLKKPSFQALLRKAEEEFGFDHPTGGLSLPCDEAFFFTLTSQIS